MHVTHICPRFKTIHGGGEPVLLNLFNHLAEMQIENTVHTYNFPASMRPMVDVRVKIKELPLYFNREFNNVLLAGFYDLFCSCFAATKIDTSTDVVCFHTENVVPALFFYKLFKRRKPTLYFCFQPPRFAYDTSEETAHSGGALGRLLPVFKAIYRPFDRMAVRKANQIATFSNSYKNWIEKIYDVKHVAVIPPGVERPSDIKDLPAFISQALQRPGSKSLLFVGKLVAWKNVDRLIRIAGLVKNTIPQLHVLIVGDGPCMSALRQQVKDARLEQNVLFCGYVPGEEVFSYCAAADLLVLLEQNASFGLSLIEANVMGLPVMAFEGGGPSDIIVEGQNGFLLPKDATDNFIAQKIESYLLNTTQRNQMQQHAYAISATYTWQRFAEIFANLATPCFTP